MSNHFGLIHKKKRGKKVIPEYDSFPVNKADVAKVKCIGKTLAGNSIKRGCQRAFVAKKPFLDGSLCILIYENTEHLNTQGELCHGTMVQGTRYALGAGLSEELKMKIAQMHAFGLSPLKSCNNTQKRCESWPLPTVLSLAIHFYCRWM